MIQILCDRGSGAKETLCHHDLLVPVPVPALKRSFAIMVSWDPVYWFRHYRVPVLKRSFAIMISRDPVYWFQRLRDPLPS